MIALLVVYYIIIDLIINLKMIAVDLSKQKALHTDLKAIQQINFTRNLNRGANVNNTTFFITEEARETILDFS